MAIGPFALSQLLVLLLMASLLVLVIVGVVWLVEKVSGSKSIGCGYVLAATAAFLVSFTLLMLAMANNW